MSQLDGWMSALGQKRTLCGAAIDRSLLRHALPNFREQLARAVRLRHIAITSCRSRCLFFPIQRVGGDGNDRNRPHRGIGLDLARDLVAVHDGQLDTHEDQIGSRSCHCCKRLFAILGFSDFVIGAGEHIADYLAIIRLVLDHQNALAHALPAGCSTRNGMVKKNVEPLPSFDSTQSRPPCISTIRLAMARPRPVPPLALVCALSDCWNSSNILAWSASAIPGPVSVTATV